MSVKAIVESPQERPQPRPDAILGPSEVREDNLDSARLVGLVSACVVLVGGLIVGMSWFNRSTFLDRIGIGSGWATFGLLLGLFGLLFHASVDRDVEFRQIYRILGWALLLVGGFISILPYPTNAGDMFSMGFLLMSVGLFFQIAPLRNETDLYWRTLTQWLLGIAGGLLALVGLLGGFWFASDPNRDFLLPIGLLLAILGLVYLVACVTSKGTSDELSFRVGLGVGGLGALVFVLALFRSLWPGLFHATAVNFLLPWGLLLMALGLAYVVVSIGLVSENRLVVMTRRELGAFFYSPVAYLVLLGFAVCHWWAYFMAAGTLLEVGRGVEPIVNRFIIQWSSIFFVLFAVPALTMRLLSEERRTGTLEVTLTTPVDEVQVVLSKFFAAWLMYLLMWVPFALYLIAFRIGVREDFDYRPLLSFGVALIVSGAGFISMGVFFSSLTRNQVISGVLTFTGMLGLTLVFMIQIVFLERQQGMGMLPVKTGWALVLEHISYIDLWLETAKGELMLRHLMFPVTATVLWLFLSVKVLETRKWL